MLSNSKVKLTSLWLSPLFIFPVKQTKHFLFLGKEALTSASNSQAQRSQFEAAAQRDTVWRRSKWAAQDKEVNIRQVVETRNITSIISYGAKKPQ